MEPISKGLDRFKTRPPTADEAAGSILVLYRRTDRAAVLETYRKLYGEEFAAMVGAKVKQKWAQR